VSTIRRTQRMDTATITRQPSDRMVGDRRVDRELKLPDGRTVGYCEFGDPKGRPVLALHGTPGSRLKYSNTHERAAQRGLRLIAFDRWGYGLSSPRSGVSLAAFGQDMVQAVSQLGLERVSVTGISGGGPFAVATAAALGDRAIALALVAPVGPIRGLVRAPTLSLFHALCFNVMPRIPGVIGGAFGLYRVGLATAPHFSMWLALSRSTAVDRAAIRDDDTRARLIDTFRSGLAPGVAGPRSDMALFGRPWGLDLSAVSTPTRLWIGTADRNVPLAAVRILAAELPNAELIEVAGAGHLWVSQNADVVLDWLDERHRP